jgi:hypothetical protein
MLVRGSNVSRAIWLLATLAAVMAGPVAAQAPATCAKTDFEAVVDAAAEALRDLNQKHKPDFQERLKTLKEKRGWGHDQFMKEAAPFVKDDVITGHEAKTLELLDQISSLGQDGAAAKTPNCALLLELEARMKLLVDIQTRKWTYMFGKLDAELAK